MIRARLDERCAWPHSLSGFAVGVVFASAAVLMLRANLASAMKQPAHLKGRPELEVASGSPVRAQRLVAVDQVPLRATSAWKTLTGEVGPTWHATWDQATGIPSRLYGAGVAAPGSVKSATVAAAFATAFLARHIDLLAPGSAVSDFVLVGNHLGGGMRSIGFDQYHRGLRVVGGQVSFRFKNDRLFVVGSEALPHLSVALAAKPIDPSVARDRARGWIAADAARADATAVAGPMVLPLVGNLRVQAYRQVYRVTVAAAAPLGRWDVYVDAATGEPVARTQTLRFASATVKFNAADRYPGGTRVDRPATHASHLVNGVATESDLAGTVSWTGTESVPLVARARGSLVRVRNDAGADAQYSLTIAPDEDVIWDARADEFTDAQLISFVHGNQVKEYCRTFAPDLAYLDQELQVTVNIDDVCNAYSDGDTINFFRADSECENTGRMSDVLYHEYGHSVHMQSVIPGVGEFEGGMGEGAADYLAATINNDSGMGRGFFFTDQPLREMDPLDHEYVWPDDVGEVHTTGLIFGGAMWDLRKALIEIYGYEAGVALSDRLYYAAIQRAVDTPSSFIEVLAADDDDGDLSNGTPNDCTIIAAFGRHGLRQVTTTIDPLDVEVPTQDGFYISLQMSSGSISCPGDDQVSASVAWRLRDHPEVTGTVTLTENDGKFDGYIPTQPDGLVIHYQVQVAIADDSAQTFPVNLADPWYEFYVGAVTPIYCTDFENDPFADGWSHSQVSGSDEWAWGQPTGGSGDPTAAYSGDKIIGINLDGVYSPDSTSYALSPTIDVGDYIGVRLQYRRWLNVEDGFYDQGTIYANSTPVWSNLNSDSGWTASTHHQDREWRFQDVPLDDQVGSGSVQIKFELASDQGLEFGGWNIDNFCIVGLDTSVCGDGEVTGREVCDQGTANSDTTPDACRTTCEPASCGDGIVDDGEQCDDANAVEDDACSSSCVSAEDGGGGDCGCTVGDRDHRPATAPGLVLLLLLAGWWRKRRG